ncbi:MAG: AAA family ATPase [Candidatus Omnitrophota bacterium]|nr:AAA family ATPase [Candidatus Omnitrophota bacterium]
MSYYKIMGFDKEPFSTNPDPDFLYLSREYDLALTNILIELRLKRGLSALLGDIGTGKTTLSRRLVKELCEREEFVFHTILNPTFENEKEFLSSLIQNFQIPFPQDLASQTVPGMRDAFEKFLLHKNLTDRRTVVLLIDEAQKLSYETLESLRILLNYETNEFKLIQIVLFGQLELYSKLLVISNFYDRIDFKFVLNPLGLEETKEMISFRLRHAGYKDARPLFDNDAVREIYYYAKGYPRGIIRLCHKCLRMLTMSRTATTVTKDMVTEVVQKESDVQWNPAIVQQKKSS